MSGTSATGGFITDVAPAPPTSADVDAAIQQLIVGTTGLAGTLVRPRWQPLPPSQPDASVTWAGFGVYAVETDDYPYIQHIGAVVLPGQANPGYSILQRHSTIRTLISFYGPLAEDMSGRFSAAVYIEQNWEPMAAVGCKLYETEEQARMPELVNNQWIDRLDLKLIMRRLTIRYYPVFDLDGAVVDLRNERFAETVTVTPTTVLRPG